MRSDAWIRLEGLLRRSRLRRLAAVPGARWAHSRLRRGWARLAFAREFLRFRSLAAGRPRRFAVRWRDRGAQLDEWAPGHGFDRHYVYHPAWAARVLWRTRPVEHVDISSTLHFCSMVSVFVPVRFHDFRRPELELDGVAVDRADLTALPFESASLPSLSCMHVVEHIGLGRYGDPLDPDGDLKAIGELQRVLAPGGDLLFVVPVGRPRLRFNSHRVYGLAQIESYFRELELVESALVPDRPEDGGLLVDPPPELFDAQFCGCGCFWYRRPR